MDEKLPLSVTTQRAIHAIFPMDSWDRVEQALLVDCDPSTVHAPAAALERIRLAVLKISAGNLHRFDDAVLLAQRDWRDVITGAGFGEDLSAHLHWHPDGI